MSSETKTPGLSVVGACLKIVQTTFWKITMPSFASSAFAWNKATRLSSGDLARIAQLIGGRLLLLTLVVLGPMWASVARAQPLTFGLIAHYLVDDTKTCGDVIFGQARLSPSVEHDMQEGDTLALAAQGLCQIEIVNTSGLPLSIGLPPALSEMALHETLREEGEVPIEEGAGLSVAVSAFPPKQRMVFSISTVSGTNGAFTLDFQ